MRRLALPLLVSLAALVACSPSLTPVVIEWTTATELNTAGFNLYRSERADGPYTKINAQLIPASSDPLVGGKYRYEDSDVMPGKTYYYQLEDVEYSGASTRHGPIAITAPSPLDAGTVAPLLLGVSVGIGAAVYLGRRQRPSSRLHPPRA